MERVLYIDSTLISALAKRIHSDAQEYINAADKAYISMNFDGSRAGVQKSWQEEANRLSQSFARIAQLIAEHGNISHNYAETLYKHIQLIVEYDRSFSQSPQLNR